MKIEFEKKYMSFAFLLFLSLSGVVLFYFAIERYEGLLKILGFFQSIMAPFIYGFVMAYSLNPLYNYTYGKLSKLNWPKFKNEFLVDRICNILSVTISMIVLICIFVGLFWAIVPTLIDSIIKVGSSLPHNAQRLNDWLSERTKDMPVIVDTLVAWTKKLSVDATGWINMTLKPNYDAIINGVSESIFGLFNIVKNLFIGVVICVFFLSNKDKFRAQIKKSIFAFMKEENASKFILGASYINRTFSNFIYGKLIDSFIIGCICFIVMSIMGWPYVTLVSVIIGVTNIIPFFGPFIGAVPTGLLMLTVDPVLCLYFLLFILILQQLDGNVIGPKILGETTGINSFWILFSIIVGGGLMGFIGMIIGIPVFVVIYSYLSFKINSRLEEKGLTIVTDDYKNLYVDTNKGSKTPW